MALFTMFLYHLIYLRFRSPGRDWVLPSKGMAPRRVAIPWHTCQRYCTHYYFFDSAPLGGIGYCLELRSSELASPRHRRRLFVSLSLHKSAMPVSSGSLAPLVKVALANTQSRCRCAPAVVS